MVNLISDYILEVKKVFLENIKAIREEEDHYALDLRQNIEDCFLKAIHDELDKKYTQYKKRVELINNTLIYYL